MSRKNLAAMWRRVGEQTLDCLENRQSTGSETLIADTKATDADETHVHV